MGKKEVRFCDRCRAEGVDLETTSGDRFELCESCRAVYCVVMDLFRVEVVTAKANVTCDTCGTLGHGMATCPAEKLKDIDAKYWPQLYRRALGMDVQAEPEKFDGCDLCRGRQFLVEYARMGKRREPCPKCGCNPSTNSLITVEKFEIKPATPRFGLPSACEMCGGERTIMVDYGPNGGVREKLCPKCNRSPD